MSTLILNLDKWRSTLRRLTPVTPARASDGVHDCSLSMREIEHEFHPDVCTRVWAYVQTGHSVDEHYAGPLIETSLERNAAALRVLWKNELVDKNLNDLLEFGARVGMEEFHMLTKSHNQIHMHGARVSGSSDGNPMETFHPNEAHGFFYRNQQPAALLWFHDHAMDVTRLNVYAGLYGAHVLRDPAEENVLPTGHHEMAMILCDRSFAKGQNTGDVKLFYEQAVALTSAGTDPEVWEATPEFVGEYPVVNGKVWPKHTVQPTFNRLRLINGANARIFYLSFFDDQNSSVKLPFDVVGTDGGFLPKPAIVKDTVRLAPGERLDLVIDFTHLAGKRVVMSGPNLIDDPTQPPEINFLELVRFEVGSHCKGGSVPYAPSTGASLPERVDHISVGEFPDEAWFAKIAEVVHATPFLPDTATINVPNLGSLNLRRFVIKEDRKTIKGTVNTPAASPGGMMKMTVALPTGDPAIGQQIVVPMISVNGKSGIKIPLMKIKKDAVEVWEFINETVDTHPMHVHLVQFRALARKLIDTKTQAYGADVAIADYEKGWKDTIACLPGNDETMSQATLVLMRFDGEIGQYVFHCHILEHEDMGMMGSFIVE